MTHRVRDNAGRIPEVAALESLACLHPKTWTRLGTTLFLAWYWTFKTPSSLDTNAVVPSSVGRGMRCGRRRTWCHGYPEAPPGH